MLSLRDDEFLIDAATYKETIAASVSNSFKGLMNSDEKRFLEYTYKQETPAYYTYVNNAIRAFGFNWPYFSFSGLGDDVIVINCYDHKQIHQVQLGDEDEKDETKQKKSMDIVATYITDTNDLFIAVRVLVKQPQRQNIIGFKEDKL
jgi:hypothetical protein